MKNLSITFAVNGSIRQDIQILTDETPEQFFAKIKSGQYLTSISTQQIFEIPSFKFVGVIQSQETLDDTEFDFESMEGLVP